MPQTVRYDLGRTSINVYPDASTFPNSLEQFGTGNAPTGNATLANGSGNGTANLTYRGNEAGKLSLAAGASLVVNLYDGSADDALNRPLAMRTIRALYLELVTPGPGNSIVFGPSGNACVSNFPFGNNAMNMTIEKMELRVAYEGVALSSGAGNIGLKNPSALRQDFWLRVHGAG